MKNQFKKINTNLKDVFIIERFNHSDNRGIFTKTFNKNMFKELGLADDFQIKESLCSTSKKNVIRGMHYQSFPHTCAKIVSVVKGRILDVIVGINKNPNKGNIGKYFSVELSSENKKSLFVPENYAHGFLVLSEEAIVVYHQNKHYNEKSDCGIKYDSFGFQWPSSHPILSEKDINLIQLNDL